MCLHLTRNISHWNRVDRAQLSIIVHQLTNQTNLEHTSHPKNQLVAGEGFMTVLLPVTRGPSGCFHFWGSVPWFAASFLHSARYTKNPVHPGFRMPPCFGTRIFVYLNWLTASDLKAFYGWNRWLPAGSSKIWIKKIISWYSSSRLLIIIDSNS